MWQPIVNHWEGLATVLGVFFTLVGLGFAVWIALRHRSAAQKVKQDSQENERYRRAVLLERASSLIRQIRVLHRSKSWDEALNQYQALRTVITDITATYRENPDEARQKLTKARLLVGQIETISMSSENMSRPNKPKSD